MFGKIILAVSLVVTAAPAMANGSMGREVSIIFVKPPREIAVIDRYRAEKKIQRMYEKEAAKSSLENQKATNKRLLEADKAYYKRLENQRKAAKKK